MLEELSIRNYALIDSITLSFRPGFNVLSGETGAGKSIIVGSLSFLMGGKAESDVIRTGCDEAGVSAVIYVKKNNSDVTDWLKSRDIECDEDTVIVRRNIKTSGRSSIYIQNVPVTRQDLAEFMGLLFDLHGQHNHESLLHKENHRRYLDRFAGIEKEVKSFSAVFLELSEKRKTLEASLKSDREREERLELLNYAIEEITNANIRPGEIRELENEAKKLSDFEKLAGFVHAASSCLFDGEQSVLSLCRRARGALDSASSVDSSLGEINARFGSLYYEAEDIAAEFRSYRDSLAFDAQRQEEVNDRLALLYKLKKKYCKGTSGLSGGEEEILSYRTQAEAEIEALATADENREKLRAQIAGLEKDVVSRAQILRQKRTAAAAALSRLITGTLKHLGMPNAGFKADILPKQQDGQAVFGPWGAEDVEFKISANTGEPLKDLSRIASGGELSRVMLAIKTALLPDYSAPPAREQPAAAPQESAADAAGVETLIFDEIDTGIGGEVALKVGEYLAKIGGILQIFCVTHLASIAVRADNHFKVEKKTEGGRTYTGVGPLSSGGSRKEIARMLAGDSGDAALAHADDLMLKYGKRSN